MESSFTRHRQEDGKEQEQEGEEREIIKWSLRVTLRGTFADILLLRNL